MRGRITRIAPHFLSRTHGEIPTQFPGFRIYTARGSSFVPHRPLAPAVFRGFYRGAALTMFGAVPAMLIVENLVPPRLSLELHNEDRFHA